LLGGIGLQTPLAYLAFVPAMALVLAWLRLERARPLPIHERDLDYIIGIGLLATATAIVQLGPGLWPIQFWMQRIDLLSLPLFAGGVATLVYGVRALWELRLALVFLLFGWPAPYVPLLGDGMRLSVESTVGALAALTSVTRLLDVVPADDGIFLVHYGGELYPLSVGSACSGANSVVAFILLGTALAFVVDGPIRRRLAWLAVGAAGTWFANLLRILLVFTTSNLLGPRVAVDLLHPIAGLIFFNLTLVAMLFALPRFGLRLSSPPRLRLSPPRQQVVRSVRLALLVCAAFAVMTAVADGRLSTYEVVANGFGEARLRTFQVSDVGEPNWSGTRVAEYEQGKQFFGRESTWRRFIYTWSPGAKVRSDAPVYVDVISSPDVRALTAYGLEACYRFHGYQVQLRKGLDIGAGVRAELISYHNPRFDRDWTALWWEWPYRDGSRTSYERLVLFLSNGPVGQGPAAPRATGYSGGSGGDVEGVLGALARSMVESRSATSSRTASVAP
jgi:exosortase